MTPLQQIKRHAEKHLGGRGRIEVKNVHREVGYSAGTVILTTRNSVEYYHAYTGSGAVGMVKTRTTELPLLPLFREEPAA